MIVTVRDGIASCEQPVMVKTHKWTFKSRFRTNAYGWKGTTLASKRLKEAVSEIKKGGQVRRRRGG